MMDVCVCLHGNEGEDPVSRNLSLAGHTDSWKATKALHELWGMWKFVCVRDN